MPKPGKRPRWRGEVRVESTILHRKLPKGRQLLRRTSCIG